MEREIKFRGKSKKSGEWLYGYYYKDNESGLYLIHTLKTDGIYKSQLVQRETVGQFTSLLDKNGKEIYEGDIVKLGDNPIHDGVLVQCKFSIKRVQFIYVFLTGANKGKATDMYDDWRSYEIVGNIFDNPDLI